MPSPVDTLVSVLSGTSIADSRSKHVSNTMTSPVSRSPSSSSLSSSLNSDDQHHQRLMASMSSFPPRRPEAQHLAVVLSRAFWKPDRDAAHCNTYHCRKPFGIFERKHHCRRCGSVFCHDCSAQVTPLLDTSKLDFIYPPNHVPVESFATPSNPMRPCRVCDDCFEELHGTIPERQKQLRAQSSITYTPPAPLLRSHTDSIIISSGSSHTSRRSSTRSSRGRRSPSNSSTPVPQIKTCVLDPHDGYPLRVPSAVCKANGGGRWQPDPVPVRYDYRPPGGKAIFEIEMEEEEERERIERENPVIVDGDIAIRKYLPPSHPRSPLRRA